MILLTVQSTLLSELYLLIADFYKYPDQDFYQRLVNGQIFVELKKIREELAIEADFFEQDFNIPDFKQFKQEYSRCFIGLNQPSALPVESIYKVWTTDQQAQVNIANQKGYLMGDSALHVKHLMAGLGLEIPKKYQQMPDHLSILLELLSYIIEHRQPEEIEQFLADHFDWLDEFKARLFEIEALPLFIEVSECLIESIEQTKKIYKNLKKGARL